MEYEKQCNGRHCLRISYLRTTPCWPSSPNLLIRSMPCISMAILEWSRTCCALDGFLASLELSFLSCSSSCAALNKSPVDAHPGSFLALRAPASGSGEVRSPGDRCWIYSRHHQHSHVSFDGETSFTVLCASLGLIPEDGSAPQ
jgi:hypothetical protein